MFIVFITVIPIAYTVSASFKTNTEIMSGGAHLIPKKTTFENYIIAWTMGSSGGSRVGRKTVTFADYTVNSLKMSAIAVLGSVIFTSMLAYTIQRGRFPGRKLLFGMYLGTMFIAAGAVTLFPIVKLAAIMKINNLYGAALVQMFTASAANLFLTIGYMKTISRELDDAAKIDGALQFHMDWFITSPLIRSTFFTCLILGVIFNLRQFEFVYLMTNGGPANKTGVLVLYIWKELQIQRLGLGNAAGVIMIAFGIILLLLMRRILRSQNYN